MGRFLNETIPQRNRNTAIPRTRIRFLSAKSTRALIIAPPGLIQAATRWRQPAVRFECRPGSPAYHRPFGPLLLQPGGIFLGAPVRTPNRDHANAALTTRGPKQNAPP